MLTSETNQALANVALKVGVNIQPGQELLITAPIEAAPFVRELHRIAYELGSSLVTTIYSDDETGLIRFSCSEDQYLDQAPSWLYEAIAKAYQSGAARLAITGGNPSKLKGIPPVVISRVTAAQTRAFRDAADLISKAWMNWTIFPYPQQGWAEAVYPELAPADALTKLFSDILFVTRADDGDPVANWTQHNEDLRQRREMLDSMEIDKLVFTGGGSNAEVGLADNHKWAGGKTIGQNGVEFNSNIPTEEVFTTPHANHVNGKLSSTKPLVFRGRELGPFSVEFLRGKATEVAADDPKDADIIRSLITTDANSCRLGEVSLVPETSRISQLGRVFYNTLLDENATCHVAFGQSFSKCMKNGYNLTREEMQNFGANFSAVHTDWMIGSSTVTVEAVSKSGETFKLIEGGQWCGT